MTDMEPRTLLEFLAAAEKLKSRTRHSVTSDGRTESVAEHSWRLALMAMLLTDEFPEADMDKVVRMCLIHDLGEAVTGDIPAFLKTDDDRAVEDDAVSRLLTVLPESNRAELRALFEEMGAQQSVEARLYKALDKLEAVIQHNEAPISSWLPLEYDLQLTHGVERCAFSPYLAALREVVRQDTLDKIARENPSRGT